MLQHRWRRTRLNESDYLHLDLLGLVVEEDVAQVAVRDRVPRRGETYQVVEPAGFAHRLGVVQLVALDVLVVFPERPAVRQFELGQHRVAESLLHKRWLLLNFAFLGFRGGWLAAGCSFVCRVFSGTFYHFEIKLLIMTK